MGSLTVEDLTPILNKLDSGVLIYDKNLHLVFGNKTLCNRYGYTLKQVAGRHMLDLMPYLKESGRYDTYRDLLKTRGSMSFVDTTLDPSFHNRVVNIQAFVYLDHLFILSSDVTGREQDQKHIEYLYQVLLVIRNVNQLIVTEKDKEVLLQRVCDLMTENKAYKGVWIGLTNSTGEIDSVYGAGFDPDRFKTFKQTVNALDVPSLTNIGRPDIFIINDIDKVCTGCPLQPEDNDSDALYASLIHENHLYGVMMVSVPKGMINQQEKELFREVSNDISYALYSLEHEEERQRISEELMESREKYRRFLDESRDGVTVNVWGKLVYVNQRFSEMIGYGVDELIGTSVVDLHPLKYQEMTRDRIERRGRGEEVPSIYEVELIRKDGSLLPVEYNIARIDYEGTPSSLAFIRDISKRRETENALEESRGLFRNFMESSTEACLILNYDMIIVDYNSAWKKLTKVSENVKGKKLLEVLPPSIMIQDRIEKYKQVIETGNSITLRNEPSPIRNNVFLDVEAFKVGNNVGIIVRDVTEKQRYEQRLEMLHSHAAALAKAESIDEVNNITKESLNTVIGNTRGSLGFVEGMFLNHKYRWGVDTDEVFLMPLDGPGITVKAVKSGKSIRVGNVNETKLYVKDVVDPTTFSELAVPVKTSDRVVGVINIESDLRDAFSDNDQKLVEMLALHIADALTRIENLGQLNFTISELRESEARWEELLSSIPDPVLINNGTNWVYANQQAADLWGYASPTEVVGRSVASFYSEEEGIRLVQRAKLRLEGKNVPRRYKQEIMRRDGPRVPVEVNVRVIDFNGEPAVLSIFRDISEQKRSEDRLSALHKITFELDLAESIEEIVDTTLLIMKEVLGYPITTFQLLKEEELITIGIKGRTPIGVLSLRGKGITAKAAREARTVLVGDVRLDPDHHPGSIDFLSELAVPIMMEKHVFGVLNVENQQLDAFTETDIRLMEVLAQNVGTALFRLNTTLEREVIKKQLMEEQVRAEQAKELDHLKTEFMNTATHEIRTPITSIRGYTELIEDVLSDGDIETAKEYFKTVTRNVDRLEILSDDLLDLQRLESGRIHLSPEQIEVKTLLDELEVLLYPKLSGSNHVLKIDAEEKLVITCDMPRLLQVLVNLVNNACKYSPDETEVLLRVTRDHDYTVFSVIDQGIGVTEENTDKLFTPFPNIYLPGVSHGSGLGLSICKGLVELHGGEIWAESEGRGKGTTFTFTIPIN